MKSKKLTPVQYEALKKCLVQHFQNKVIRITWDNQIQTKISSRKQSLSEGTYNDLTLINDGRIFNSVKKTNCLQKLNSSGEVKIDLLAIYRYSNGSELITESLEIAKKTKDAEEKYFEYVKSSELIQLLEIPKINEDYGQYKDKHYFSDNGGYGALIRSDAFEELINEAIN